MMELNFDDHNSENMSNKEICDAEVSDNGIIENELIDMPNEEYHSHRDYISASQIKDLIKNPYKFFHHRPQEPKYVFDIGTAIHLAILEAHKFNDEVAVAPECDRRTAKGKQIWNDFQESSKGKIILKSEDFDMIMELQKSTLSIPEVQELLKDGVSEMSYFKTTPKGTKMKVRPDRLTKYNVVIDVKSCRDASPDAFARDCAAYMYYVQSPYYKKVLGCDRFVFLAIEKTYPYMVGIYEISQEDEDKGWELIVKALKTSKEPEKYKTPLYKAKDGEVCQTLQLPNWIHYINND